jgi:hypothetical protein
MPEMPSLPDIPQMPDISLPDVSQIPDKVSELVPFMIDLGIVDSGVDVLASIPF